MSVRANRTRAAADRSNLYDEITGRIIVELDAGGFPQVQPWGTQAGESIDSHTSTLRSHSGINVLTRPLERPCSGGAVRCYTT